MYLISAGQYDDTLVENSATCLLFLQHHEIEVSNTLLCVFAHSLCERRLADYITNILIYEGVSEEKNENLRESDVRGSYFLMSDTARKPYPFFSVKTTSMSAYARRWNLEEVNKAVIVP